MISAVGSAMRVSAPRIPVVSPGADDDTPNVEMLPEMSLVEVAPAQFPALPPDTEAYQQQGEQNPFAASVERAARAAQTSAVGNSTFAQAPLPKHLGNKSIATGFDPAPVNTPVGFSARLSAASAYAASRV